MLMTERIARRVNVFLLVIATKRLSFLKSQQTPIMCLLLTLAQSNKCVAHLNLSSLGIAFKTSSLLFNHLVALNPPFDYNFVSCGINSSAFSTVETDFNRSFM